MNDSPRSTFGLIRTAIQLSLSMYGSTNLEIAAWKLLISNHEKQIESRTSSGFDGTVENTTW